MIETKGRETGVLLLVLFFSALALCVGLWHGLPNVYVPDTHIVRNALGMAQTKTLWPPAGAFSTYPYLLAYLLLPIYAATFLLGRVFGAYQSAEDFGQKVVEDPTLIYLEARILIALFGVLAVFYLFKCARRLGFSVTTAAGASLLLAFNPLFVQLGHQARPWVPIIAAMVFTLYHAMGHGRKDFILAAVGAGLAFAMHQVGGAVLLIPLIQRITGENRLKSLIKLLLLFSVTALLLGYGHKFWGGPAHDVIKTDESTLDIGGQKLLLKAFSGDRAWIILKSFFGYDPILACLGSLGLLWALFKAAAWKPIRWAAGGFCLFIGIVFLIYNGTHIRYMLPLIPFLALGVAWIAKQTKPIFLLVLVCFSALQAFRVDLLYCSTDTRDLACQWMEENATPGARIALEGYGPVLTPNVDSLRFLKEEAKVALSRKERMILGRKTNPNSFYLIPLERFYDYKSYWPHQYKLGGERSIGDFLKEMKCEWLITTDRWPRYERHAPLMNFIRAHAEPVKEFSPGASPQEATFPMDMDFPLTSLWTLKHSGPLIRLFKINSN